MFVCVRTNLMNDKYVTQVVDMRWGIREEAQNDHMTSELCIKEIKKCQRISVGPAFVVSLHFPHLVVVGQDEKNPVISPLCAPLKRLAFIATDTNVDFFC